MRLSILFAIVLTLMAGVAVAQPAGPPSAGPPGPSGPHPGMGPPPPTRGAQFALGQGDRRMFIKCADEDSTKACVDAVSAILDKMLQSR